MGAEIGENLNWSSYKGKKVKCTLVKALRLCTGGTVHRGSRSIVLLFLTTALEGFEGSASRPGRSLPRERPGTHCTGGWVGPRTGLDRCGKSRPPTGFDPRTVQPVASSYTDWATRPTGLRVKYPYFYIDHNERFKYIQHLRVLHFIVDRHTWNAKGWINIWRLRKY